MSTVSGTGSSSTVNPYAIAYSVNDLMATEDPLTAATSSNSKTSSSSSSSSGNYSQDLVSSMSGLDVNSLVTQMMKSDQVKLNLLLQKEQTTQWTQDRFRSTITNLTNFKDNYYNVMSANNMLSPSKYSTNVATSTNAAVTTTVSNDAQAGSYRIDWTQLASAPKLYNTDDAAGNLGLNSSSTATDLANKIGGSGKLTFTLNGKDVTYDLKSAANANKTMKQVMSDLSSQSGATFNYSELTGKITATGSDTGASKALAISWKQSDTDTAAFMSKAFGLIGGTAPTTSGTDVGGNATYNYTANGKDGSFTVTEPDSSSRTVSSSTNKLSYDGVTYNIASNAGASGTATINVNADTSAFVDKIQKFKDDYNNLVDGIQKAIGEKKDYTYKPLTSAQEAQMSDSQIAAWNQKAQQGLLSNDNTLDSMLTEMREAFYTKVQGTGLTMKDLGLSTSNDPKEGGKLTFTAADLQATLQTKPQQVINAFTQTSTSVPSYNADLTSSQRATRKSEEGIFQRLSDITEEYAGTHIDKDGNQGKLLMKAGTVGGLSEYKNTLYKQLKNDKDAVTNFKVKMASDKKMYTAKFTALQSALSAMSSQQSYLSSMLSSSSGN